MIQPNQSFLNCLTARESWQSLSKFSAKEIEHGWFTTSLFRSGNQFINCTTKAAWTGGGCDGGATEVSIGSGTMTGLKIHHNFAYNTCGGSIARYPPVQRQTLARLNMVHRRPLAMHRRLRRRTS